MKNITTILTTKAVFSDDGLNRYLLTKTWDASKPTLAIIMMAPAEASGVALDNTTMLVLNNADRLGYGTVAILNLFARVNDFSLQHAGLEDAENLEVIVSTAQSADAVIYAAGVGKATNKKFQQRQKQVLEALRPMEEKLHCLSDADGNSRLQHPLSPAVRIWYLMFEETSVNDLLEVIQISTRHDVFSHSSQRSGSTGSFLGNHFNFSLFFELFPDFWIKK